jgi:hypothetical protein
MGQQVEFNAVCFFGGATAVSKRDFCSTPRPVSGNPFRMAKMDDTNRLSWAPWALLAVAATSALTIAATLHDLL